MKELDDIPLYELNTLYHILWKEKEEESKMTDEQKQSMALGRVIEDSI